MENKYYTPKIEEFHVGFEYEEYDDVNDDFTDENPLYKKVICDEYLEIQHIILNRVRVKHLDRGDAEELGWVNNPKIDKNYFKLGDFVLRIKGDNISIYIYDEHWVDKLIFDSNKVINKSRLKLVMEMLNINQP